MIFYYLNEPRNTVFIDFSVYMYFVLFMGYVYLSLQVHVIILVILCEFNPKTAKHDSFLTLEALKFLI